MMPAPARTRTSIRTARARLLSSLVAASSLTACTGLRQPYPAKETFAIVTPPVKTTAARVPAVLRVERVRIAAPYDSLSFMYRVSDAKLQPDYYSEFVAPPDRLLTADLITSLAGANVFTTVIDPGATVDTPLRLETSVVELAADYRDAKAPRAVIRARFLLLDDRLDATAVIGEWTLESRQAPATDDAAGVALAWGKAWGDVISQLVQVLSKTHTSR